VLLSLGGTLTLVSHAVNATAKAAQSMTYFIDWFDGERRRLGGRRHCP
jgi:hypothetical protein